MTRMPNDQYPGRETNAPENVHGKRTAMPPEAMLLQMSIGQTISQLIYVAAKLGIADQLADGPLAVTQLADQLAVDTQAPYRIMRALASIGIFTEINRQQFALTALAEPLQTSHPASIRAWAILVGEPWHRRAWNEILYSVTTGKPAFDHVFGMGTCEYFTQNQEAATVFYDAMTGLTGGQTTAITAAYDFSGYKTIVDIGGGTGALLTAILQTCPDAYGVLFDLPPVIVTAQPMLGNTEIAQRCKLISGDFFDAITTGGDLYLMKYILHDWDDNKAGLILQNCRKAMPTHAKLLIAETVIPLGNTPHSGKFADILMLILEGGLERTADEFQMLLTNSGFKLTRVIETESALSLVEAEVA